MFVGVKGLITDGRPTPFSNTFATTTTVAQPAIAAYWDGILTYATTVLARKIDVDALASTT